ncbi:MAG: GDP-mannose 4,6-dehydratase [Actinomycetota bacterium]|nr:GDP-mannose 4,6-dehydratase [Actinomycetota bacterium]
MRWVVAGAAGFIGSHLCEQVLAQGHQVVGVDCLVTGSRANIEGCLQHPAFNFVEHDIRQPLAVDGPVERVLNLASPASPVDFDRIPLFILETGSKGTQHLLDLALAKGARFFLASTSEAYGDPEVHPQVETYNGNVSSTGPRSCYDEAKRYAEAITMAYHRAHGLPVRIARIFNTYGERMRPDDGRVVCSFIDQALRGQPLTVFGDGGQTRSFVHVSDEVQGLLAVIEGPLTGPVNVGNPDEITMLQLAQRVVAACRSSSPVQLHPLPAGREGDPNRRCPDTGLLQSFSDWKPVVSLDEGLRRTIDWMRALA